MKILALDCSTETASLALLDEGAVRASVQMDGSRRRSQEWFSAAAEILQQAGWSFGDLDALAVGRGPGSYTGLRVSLTAAHGWALPRAKPVWTVTSAAALAAEIFCERSDLQQVVASGLARRGTIWAGLFVRDPGVQAKRIGDWKLLPASARGMEWEDVHWIEPDRPPQAEWVGRLFFAGGPSEEPHPLYLHPAVTAPARFSQNGSPLQS